MKLQLTLAALCCSGLLALTGCQGFSSETKETKKSVKTQADGDGGDEPTQDIDDQAAEPTDDTDESAIAARTKHKTGGGGHPRDTDGDDAAMDTGDDASMDNGDSAAYHHREGHHHHHPHHGHTHDGDTDVSENE